MASKLPLPRVKPETVGMSSERLARLRPAMQRFIDREQVPNMVTLVAREGKIVHFEAQGYADREMQRPAAMDTIFRLYSNTKPITGVAATILCEESLLNLNDPVSRYIPAFKNPQVATWGVAGRKPLAPNLSIFAPAQREITIRDCLANTTGLATPFTASPLIKIRFKKFVDESGWDIRESIDTPPRKSYHERVAAHARIPLSFEPGTEYTYHLGYPIIGVIIEIITGKTLEEFYQERIFKPLGMKDTSFYLEKSKIKRFSSSYKPKYKNGKWGMAIFDKAETSEKVTGPKIHFGAGGDLGGLLSTVSDYARFAQMLLNNGEFNGTRILSLKSVELMTSDQTGGVGTDLGQGILFGLGLEVYGNGNKYPVLRTPGSYGKGGACGTIYFADPKEKLLGICFTQKMISNAVVDEMDVPTVPDHSYLEEFERLVYQALL
jgi:CubicO group peptidase (beta-lactamase class C family)